MLILGDIHCDIHVFLFTDLIFIYTDNTREAKRLSSNTHHNHEHMVNTVTFFLCVIYVIFYIQNYAFAWNDIVIKGQFRTIFMTDTQKHRNMETQTFSQDI